MIHIYLLFIIVCVFVCVLSVSVCAFACVCTTRQVEVPENNVSLF